VLIAVAMVCVRMACAIVTPGIMDPPALSRFLAQATVATMEPAATEPAIATQDMAVMIARPCWNALMTAVAMDDVCLDSASAIQVMEARTVPLRLSAHCPLVTMAQSDSAVAMVNVPMESASVILDSLVTTVPHE